MVWQQLRIKVDAKQVDVVTEWMERLGAVAVTYRDAQDQALLEPLPGATPVWDQNWICGLFAKDSDLSILIALMKQQFPQLDYQIDQLAEQDWQQVGRTDFHAVCFAERLWVCPSWEAQPEGVVVKLDPGLAFGTGSHPTTALCLDWLAQQVLTGKQIIDYGCGSGILAMAALKLGAVHAWAVDYDPQALLATQENAKQNQLSEQVLTTVAPEQLPPVTVDMLIANILANPLIELANRFAALLKPQGQLALSGILVEQVENVQQAYAPWFENWLLIEKDGWVRLTADRSNT